MIFLLTKSYLATTSGTRPVPTTQSGCAASKWMSEYWERGSRALVRVKTVSMSTKGLSGESRFSLPKKEDNAEIYHKRG